MLDHTQNQRLHDLIVHVAPLLPGPHSSLPATQSHAEDLDPPSFRSAKLERILDRVYNRLADETESAADPRLRELIAETVAPHPEDCPSFSAGKLRRILDRVQMQRAVETEREPIPAEAAPRLGLRAILWANLRALAIAIFSPRPLPAPTRSNVGSRRRPEPLLEGPRAD